MCKICLQKAVFTMGNGIISRFGNAFGLAREETSPGYYGPTAVNRPQLTIAVYSPASFDDVKLMSDALKEKRAVLVHFDRVDNALGRRIMDYMNGLGYALSARVEKVSEQIILYAPDNTAVEKEPSRTAKPSRWF